MSCKESGSRRVRKMSCKKSGSQRALVQQLCWTFWNRKKDPWISSIWFEKCPAKKLVAVKNHLEWQRHQQEEEQEQSWTHILNIEYCRLILEQFLARIWGPEYCTASRQNNFHQYLQAIQTIQSSHFQIEDWGYSSDNSRLLNRRSDFQASQQVLLFTHFVNDFQGIFYLKSVFPTTPNLISNRIWVYPNILEYLLS